ncbi:porin [Cupriavidus sp. WKF15]|uniref:porin n=1 Tax=Cupriavidus sp. WKF15 TaxID=3032282 RepID=UPI0023E2BAF1|nr:porin [Cupriavidus sp. WKF15]WER49158.1 porin [Cupriavidus sp. WKF15]
MKIRLACLAALSVLPVTAHAQASTTPYSILDAGMEHVASVPATGAGGRYVMREYSTDLPAARWGLRDGKEPGTGLKTYVAMESGTYADLGNTTQANRASVGAAYALGPARAVAGYRWSYDSFSTVALRSNLYWLGVQYQVTPAIQLGGAAYYNDAAGNSGDPYSFMLTGSYAWSKRTDVYTVLGFARSRNGPAMGLTGFGPSLNPYATALSGPTEQVGARENQIGAVIGLRHRF